MRLQGSVRAVIVLSARVRRDERVRTLALAAYYLAVLVGLLVMYGRGQFAAPGYIYQGF